VSALVTWEDLSSLLHDAQLVHLAWRPAATDVSLSFHCLRRNTDGSALADPTVRVQVSGVTVLAVAYDATCRPSQFVPSRLLTPADLRGWPCGSEAFVWVNNPERETRLLDALRVDWFAGAADEVPACARRLGLAFGNTFPSLALLIGGAELAAFAGDEPLSLDRWAEQYNAWWAGWQRHWAAKEQNPLMDLSLVVEDAVIPAGIDTPLPANYAWPNETVVAWEVTDAPADLLATLTRWFEDEVGKPSGSFGCGARFYARQIDSWWVEGKRAGVTVRGVEHSPPTGVSPARNIECVQECLLCRRPTGWAVQPLSRGWPPYGSAPARPASEKPWLARWHSGTVLSERCPEQGRR
jgi:hypothetical protein